MLEWLDLLDVGEFAIKCVWKLAALMWECVSDFWEIAFEYQPSATSIIARANRLRAWRLQISDRGTLL